MIFFLLRLKGRLLHSLDLFYFPLPCITATCSMSISTTMAESTIAFCRGGEGVNKWLKGCRVGRSDQGFAVGLCRKAQRLAKKLSECVCRYETRCSSPTTRMCSVIRFLFDVRDHCYTQSKQNGCT